MKSLPESHEGVVVVLMYWQDKTLRTSRYPLPLFEEALVFVNAVVVEEGEDTQVYIYQVVLIKRST
jgi:hypothetical protein